MSKKNKLEDFIKDNRKAFDDRPVPGKVWKGLEETLFSRAVPWWNGVGFWRAAAVFFMVVSAYFLGQQTFVSEGHHQAMNLNDYYQVEAFYLDKINEKVSLIDSYDKSDGLSSFTHDFQQLEAMFQLLKEEMKIQPSKQVREALELNLLIRIDLLNQRLKKLDEEERAADSKKQSSS